MQPSETRPKMTAVRPADLAGWPEPREKRPPDRPRSNPTRPIARITNRIGASRPILPSFHEYNAFCTEVADAALVQHRLEPRRGRADDGSSAASGISQATGDTVSGAVGAGAYCAGIGAL